MEVMMIPIVIGLLGTVTKRLVKGLEDLEKRGQGETIQNYCIIKISQNTEESPGDLLLFKLQWKTLKGVKY